MTGWRERLCGSSITQDEEAEAWASLQQFAHPPRTISCGGGFYPVNENVANMSTNPNFLLPTNDYSVLVFREDGTAVIYSESEGKRSSDESDVDLEISDTEI